ncbi:MAG: tripartite tricarboxylate transporter permease [Hyphomicrobiales bacterium]
MAEYLHLIGVGFANALEPFVLAMMLAGMVIGLVAGVLPGISMINAVVLALPFTYFMEPTAAVIMLISIYCSGMFAGAITAILINIPGSPGNAPTAFDGYPMTRKGEAALAIGTSIICSGIGGFLSAIVLATAAPALADYALGFNSMDKFALVFLGMACVTNAGSSSRVRAISALLLGAMVGTIGLAPIYPAFRFTFGTDLLQAGVNFIIALIGLFAIAELFDRFARRNSGWEGLPANIKVRLPGLAELKRLKGTIMRSTAIGTSVGIIPGEGGAISAFLAYGVEKQVSKHGQAFGTGVLEGVAAPETANNASTGGALIPTLALGIPGSAAAAVIMGALLLHGFEPGPLLFVKAPETVYTIFAAVLMINLLMIAGGLVTTRMFVQLLKVPEPVLSGGILLLCFIGAFGVRNQMADIWMMLGFGVLGFLFRRFDFSVPAFIIGLLLGPMAETYFLRTMLVADGNPMVLLTQPLSAFLIACGLLIVFVPEVAWIRRNLAGYLLSPSRQSK